MVSAINEYSQILYLRAKFLKVVILRLYGCEETSLETNPMDKKKAISESHFAHAQNKCNWFNWHLYWDLVYNCRQFDLVKRLTDECSF